MTNPWKGLSSYCEEDLNTYQFRGRTNATGKFYSYITQNLISTLYGKTGCGKTSLLQAGIFPILRQESYLPIMCRMSQRSANESFADYLLKCLTKEFECHHIQVSKSENPVDQAGDDSRYYLWQYFYGNTFTNKQGDLIFPVIVLDQFEEILLSDKDDSICLLEQLNYLVGDDLRLPEEAFANFRVTIALREDFLYLLEDAIDEKRLMLLRENRMRLSPLNEDEAEEVIQLGKDIFVNEEEPAIYKSLIQISKGKRGHISTNMLSLLCSQVFSLYQNKRHSELVSLQDLEELREDPLHKFYTELKISNQTREFIERRLIVNGFRCPVTKSEFKENVPEEERKYITTGENKILQVVTAGENECVELIHDTLAMTIFNIQRRKINKTQSRRLVNLGTESILCSLMAIALIFQGILSSSLLFNITYSAVLLSNLLFSYASYGKHAYSKSQLLIIWLFSVIFSCVAISVEQINTESAIGIFTFLYVLIVPIINLVRKHENNRKLSFNSSLKYVFGLEVIFENKKIRNYCFLPSVLTLSIGLCSISGFFFNSIGLWIILPVSVIVASQVISSYCEDSYSPSLTNIIKTAAYPLLYTILFILLQHTVWNRSVVTTSIFILLCMWCTWKTFTSSTNYGFYKKSIISIVVSLLYGITLPMLSLGYNPFLFVDYARDLTQPTTKGLPVISLHDAEGKHCIADRHNLIMQPIKQEIDSVKNTFGKCEEFMRFSGMCNLDYWFYDCFSTYDENIKPNITLFTKGHVFSWAEDYNLRASNTYLTYYIDQLSKYDYDKWSEQEFDQILQLSLAYRAIGGDSIQLADNLEYVYFARRLMQTEIYEALRDSNFVINEENVRDVILLTLEPKYREGYNDSFVKVCTSSLVMQNRIKTIEQLFKAITQIEDYAHVDKSKLEKFIQSYSVNPISVDFYQNAIDQSDKMLFYTKNTMGCRMDSMYAAIYEKDQADNYVYWNSRAWFNIFLGKYKDAEKYARQAIKCVPHKNLQENIVYTQLVTSLFLSGDMSTAIDVFEKNKERLYYNGSDGKMPLFPLIADSVVATVRKGICQDINSFIKLGIINDTTTTEFRELRKYLGVELSVPSEQYVFKYKNGWNLSRSLDNDQVFQLYNDNGQMLPEIHGIEPNINDSTAICKLENGSFCFLDLKNMKLIGDEYDYAWHFSEGLAAVEKNGSIGVINKKGQTIIDYTHQSEGWLKEHPFKLMFHNGRIALPNEKLYYSLYDVNDMDLWPDYLFPYVQTTDAGFIVKQNEKEEKWVGCNLDGIIKKNFADEISDIVVNTIIKDTIYLYNHVNICDYQAKENVPDINLAGLWYCEELRMYAYYGQYSSDFMWMNNHSVRKGKYYIDSNFHTIYYNKSSEIKATENTLIELSDGKQKQYEIEVDNRKMIITSLQDKKEYLFFKQR